MTATKASALPDNPIARDVLEGLSAFPKRLPPKLFYDAEGSRFFEQITETPEYYPTRTERGIFQKFVDAMAEQAGSNLTLVELGSGSARKTRLLIEAILRRQAHLDFYPIDLSPAALEDAAARLSTGYPNLLVRPITADYSVDFPQLNELPGRKLVLFLGSTIGNFVPNEAVEFLARLRQALAPGDAALVGFDMVKDAATLHDAYNDAQGVTELFNKNVLGRINRELGGEFDLDSFAHVSFFNEAKSRIEMHLESRREQRVWVHDLARSFHFARGERIHTENSYKFTEESIASLMCRSGVRIEKTWTDAQQWFSEVMGRV